MPGSVMRCRGRVGSGSSLRRSWFMYWRKVMGLSEVARPPHRLQEWTLANELAGVTRQHLQHLPFGRRQVQGLGGADGFVPLSLLGGQPLQGARENQRGLRVDAVVGVGQ